MMQKYRFACRTWLSCTGKFTDAALLNEQMNNLHKHDNDDERLEIHNEHENEHEENAEMLRNKQDAVDDDVLITWMQNVHDANDAKMTIAEMLRYEMHSAHDANDAEVLSADMSSAHYWAPPLIPLPRHQSWVPAKY